MPLERTTSLDAGVPIAGFLRITFSPGLVMLSPISISIALLCFAFVVAVMYLFVDERA